MPSYTFLIVILGAVTIMPVPVAERSKARVYGRSLAGIAGSNPAGGMDSCPLWVLCVLSGRGLCDGLITRPEESYRLVRPCLWSRNLHNEAAKTRKGCKCRIEEERTNIQAASTVTVTSICKERPINIIKSRVWVVVIVSL